MTMDVVSAELKTVLRRLKLSGMLSTLADRLALSRQQKMPHQDFLLMALSDEASRRDSLGAHGTGQGRQQGCCAGHFQELPSIQGMHFLFSSHVAQSSPAPGWAAR